MRFYGRAPPPAPCCAPSPRLHPVPVKGSTLVVKRKFLGPAGQHVALQLPRPALAAYTRVPLIGRDSASTSSTAVRHVGRAWRPAAAHLPKSRRRASKRRVPPPAVQWRGGPGPPLSAAAVHRRRRSVWGGRLAPPVRARRQLGGGGNDDNDDAGRLRGGGLRGWRVASFGAGRIAKGRGTLAGRALRLPSGALRLPSDGSSPLRRGVRGRMLARA